MYIMCLSCYVEKSKTIYAKLFDKSRNNCHSNRFQGCSLSGPGLYCYRFLPFVLHESGTSYILVSDYIAKVYLVNAV